MKREHLITILADKEKAERRIGVVRPSKRRRSGARRLQFPAITFYDLASIVSGESFVDHPILKSPTYTASAALNDLGNFIGVEYEIEQFDNDDYQAFTDSLFDIAPVTEWKDNFRKLEYELNEATSLAYPCTYPHNLTMRNIVNTAVRFIEDTDVDISTEAGRIGRAENLDNHGFAWDSRGLEYRGLEKIDYNFLTGGVREWFTASTNNTDFYKVTASYDPDAPDVSGLAISGKIDVYLVPQIGLFFAAAAHAEIVFTPDAEAGFDVMFAYQVLPRQNYPRYVDPYSLLDQQTLNDIYVAYQKNRSGMVGSFWQKDAGFLTITETPMSAADWGTAYSYKSVVDNLDFLTVYGTPGGHYRTVPSDDFRYLRTDPFLMAVIKMRGGFYYVWSVENEIDGIGADAESILVSGYEVESEDYED